MSVDELKVLPQGCSTHRMKRYTPKGYSDSPSKAARWCLCLNVGRYGKCDNYYLECLPMPSYEQKLSRSFRRRNVENSVSYCITELTPKMAESHAGVHIYKVGEHSQLLN